MPLLDLINIRGSLKSDLEKAIFREQCRAKADDSAVQDFWRQPPYKINLK